MRPNNTVWVVLCVVLAASLVSARPSPEAEADAGYSYKPPAEGLRLNYQPPWRPTAAESRVHASEVTVEQVPIRLIQHSRELPPPARSSSDHRGAYYFPQTSARLQQEQHNQQYYRSQQQENEARAQQQNRGAFNIYVPNNAQQNTQNQQQQHNVAPQQNYRQNEINQQRVTYPQQNNNNINLHNNNPQYQRQQQYQNQQQQHHQVQTPQQQYQPQQGRSMENVYNQGQITASGSNTGYQYNTPNNNNNNVNNNVVTQYPNNPSTTAAAQVEEEDTTTEASPMASTSTELPRITIAISKSTVIHTGKGSYQIDEKTGKPKPIIAEAHSYAGLPEPTKKPDTDALSGEGTGNFPIIAKGTPPEDEEEENEEDTEANTEQPTTTSPNAEEPNTAAPPTAQAPLYSSSWPYQQYGHHAHVVVAPGQTQYFALGTSAPMSQYYAPTATQQYYTAVQPASQYLQPSQYIQPTAHQYLQQPLSYAHQYGAYHPSVFARLNSNGIQRSSLKWPFANYFPIVIRDPFVSMYGALSQVLEYGPEADICRGKNHVAPTAEVPIENAENAADTPADARVSDQEQDSQQQTTDQYHDRSHRMVIYKGGVAIAGPGGTADAGHGGTAIVGPGGTAYSSPNGISVVGPGGKVVLQGANSETILAKGPVIYYHKA